MYSNITLYYLNQLGITPWISKENHSVLFNSAQRTPKLIIFTGLLHAKAESLLRKMIVCMDINEEQLEIVQIQDNISSNNQWFQEKNPIALWALGIKLSDYLSEQLIHCPVINSLSPEHLIDYPSDKRKVLNDLYSLKSLFSSAN